MLAHVRLLALKFISGSLLSAYALALTGCVGVALTAGGVGGGVEASHQMGGLVYRTFTEPLPRVRVAVLDAFKRMGIEPGKTEKMELGERLLAQAGNRDIEIELEALTPKATRMRAVVRKDGGMVVDSSTAVEIINQTEQSISHHLFSVVDFLERRISHETNYFPDIVRAGEFSRHG